MVILVGGGDRPLLGQGESTRRNYTVAANQTLSDGPNAREWC